MIAYAEKGLGLHNKIAALGYWLVDGVDGWVSPDDVAVQSIIDAYTIADSAAHVCTEIDAHAAEMRNRVTAGISPGEMASWAIKRAEAVVYALTGNPADAPLLSLEAQARGVPLADVCARVSANSTALGGLEAAIAGAAGRHRDAVKACATFAEIAAYDWRTGWPAV
ncbi:MAG: hypothetical protein Q8O34_00715 [Rhodocyclaceae bacterium]|nr:hypothetical protein [Rhodocyclaceae bacterium]